jgi:hypothetical protein
MVRGDSLRVPEEGLTSCIRGKKDGGAALHLSERLLETVPRHLPSPDQKELHPCLAQQQSGVDGQDGDFDSVVALR